MFDKAYDDVFTELETGNFFLPIDELPPSQDGTYVGAK